MGWHRSVRPVSVADRAPQHGVLATAANDRRGYRVEPGWLVLHPPSSQASRRSQALSGATLVDTLSKTDYTRAECRTSGLVLGW
jgi:hypothetical protein